MLTEAQEELIEKARHVKVDRAVPQLLLPLTDSLAAALLLRMRGKLSRPELATFRKALFEALDHALGIKGVS